MKWAILLVIKAYWKLIPIRKRRSCLFKESCSQFVYRNTIEHGFMFGLHCFFRRRKQCRPGYEIIFSNSGLNEIKLADGMVIDEMELSDKMKRELDMCRSLLANYK